MPIDLSERVRLCLARRQLVHAAGGRGNIGRVKVVFLAPAYPPEMQQYTRGLAEVGATVYGVGDSHPGSLPASVRQHLTDYLQVPRILDEEDVIRRVHAWMRGREVDRVLANWEVLVLTAARLRELFGLPGMSVDAVNGFRDKQIMKERVAAAGLRVPGSVRVLREADAFAAAEQLGYPMVVKPIAGAGSADTYAVENRAELESALARMGHVEEAICEEYIDGEEFTFDTVSIGGVPAYENVAQYLPKPIVARSVESVSPVIVTVRDLAQEKMAKGLALGRNVLKALGMGDGFTHMEWFLKPNGEAVFGEIGCRPGGAMIVDQMNYTSDIDLFREWARVACWGRFDAVRPRKYNAAIIFKRARGNGRISRIEGLGRYLRRFGEHVVEAKLLPIGTQRRNWKQTLISDGHILVRHADWDTARAIADAAANDVTLYAE
ncbi:MAG: ATP-grasp domain-containing protein [Myxococcales bacterium]|nr:ATP-grasp domain-containing protein [Myxococcales bacterium]